MSYKDFFKGKKIAVVGCGEHGAMISDIKFLARQKAIVSVYELRSAERLGKIARELETLLLSGGVAGRIASVMFSAATSPVIPETVSIESLAVDVGMSFPARLAEAELIILAPDIPRNSSFLKDAVKAGVRIEYPDVLLFKLIPPTTLVGVMGSVGKTAVAGMIFDMLDRSFNTEGVNRPTREPDIADQDEEREQENSMKSPGLHLIDAEVTGALASLKKVKKSDIIIARLPEGMMSEYRTARITPHVAVLTHVSKALAEEGKKFFGILEFQTYNSFIVASDATVDTLKTLGGFQPKAKILRTRPTTVPNDWNIAFHGAHTRDNAALAVEATSLFKVDRDIIRLSLEHTRVLKGRIELVRKTVAKKPTKNQTVKTIPEDVEFYNDTASVRPEATFAALRTLSVGAPQKKVILILGGAYTGASYSELFNSIDTYVSHLILLPGSGTLTERWRLDSLQGTGVGEPENDGQHLQVWHAPTIADAVTITKDIVHRGDRVLFSPGFGALGLHESRIARGEAFIKAVKAI